MNYPSTIELLQKMGITNVVKRTIRTRGGDVDDGIEFSCPSLLIRPTVEELKWKLPADTKVYFDPNREVIRIEDR